MHPGRIRMVIASVLLKVSDDLHDLLLSSETLLSGLMRLASFPCGLFGRLGSCAVTSVCRGIIKSDNSLRQHYFVGHVVNLSVRVRLMVLLLLDKDELLVQGDANVLPKVLFRILMLHCLKSHCGASKISATATSIRE